MVPQDNLLTGCSPGTVPTQTTRTSGEGSHWFGTTRTIVPGPSLSGRSTLLNGEIKYWYQMEIFQLWVKVKSLLKKKKKKCSDSRTCASEKHWCFILSYFGRLVLLSEPPNKGSPTRPPDYDQLPPFDRQPMYLGGDCVRPGRRSL